LIVASANGDVGMPAAIAILRAGGSALDAAEAACRLVESNLDDHSVGTGAYPNAVGEVELDASIMDGQTRRAGAVAALKGYPHPISIARRILDKLPQHVLLVAEGAARFAKEEGFETANLLTTEAFEAWMARKVVVNGEEYAYNGEFLQKVATSEPWRAQIGAAGSNKGIRKKRTTSHGPSRNGATDVRSLADPLKNHGTVNFIVKDRSGNIASAVSTSGWAFKYPGRAGDSPLIGSGNYCDDRFGACACTGLGEWAIRAATAKSVVMGMQLGMDLVDACRFAMKELRTIPVPEGIEPVMNLVALDRHGRHAGFTTAPGREYIWQTASMESFETRLRTVLAPP
jgi:beta-aspartyl-peptidase (threonine type)